MKKKDFFTNSDNERNLNHFIRQVAYLHVVGHLDARQIMEFFAITGYEEGMSSEEKEEMLQYIEKVIAKQ